MATVDEWVAAYRAFERAKDKLTAIEAELLPTMAVGQVLEGSKGKVRKRDRGVLKPDRLRDKISSSLWTSITERKPVAALYKAAIQRGKLTQDEIDQCSDRSKPWLELM
jgi:hypothetical protein